MINSEYLKMILALPNEFFKGWGWKDGDSFIRLYDGHIGYLGNYKIDELSVQFTWGSTWAGCLEDIRPIPSQGQLIGMISNHSMLKTVKLTELQVIERVSQWHVRRDPCVIQNKCCEQLYLEVLQWLNDKTWDGETWI